MGEARAAAASEVQPPTAGTTRGLLLTDGVQSDSCTRADSAWLGCWDVPPSPPRTRLVQRNTGTLAAWLLCSKQCCEGPAVGTWLSARPLRV
eukprot:365612-Chlamydomonas_euryale.AAC.5